MLKIEFIFNFIFYLVILDELNEEIKKLGNYQSIFQKNTVDSHKQLYKELANVKSSLKKSSLFFNL